MKAAGGLLVGLLIACLAGPAAAGAWNPPRGKGQVIVKFESLRAGRGFDPAGELQSLPAERRDTVLAGFAEYGVTDRIAIRFKGDWQSGEDAWVDFEGRGPLELGVAWQAWRNDHTAVSLYAGVAEGGEGRNAGYAVPGVGGRDWEVRASIGRSFPGGTANDWLPVRTFAEVEVARRMRDALPDETRLDATLGAHLGEDWMLLAQGFGGQADDDGPQWLSLEASVVRDFGEWSLQAGWRRAVRGREIPESSGPVVALWRRF